MKVNSMNSFKGLPQFEVIDQLAEGGFDVNIQDVVVEIVNINTDDHYIAERAYFEHGVDEYYIDEEKLQQI